MVTFGYQRYQVFHDSMQCTWSTVTSVTWWLPVVTFGYQRYQVLHDSMLCTWCIVTSITWWVPSGYRHYLVLQDPRLYTWCTGQHCYHSSYLCLASAITIIVQWIHSIVALPLLPVTWACNLTASPHNYLATTGFLRGS